MPDFAMSSPSKKAKLKKDGTPKEYTSNKKKGQKSEVYPFKDGDMKRITRYFKDNDMWIHYLMFILACNLGRRVRDIIKLKWSDIFYETGGMRNTLTMKEENVDKPTTLYLNIACRDGINLYVAKTGCDVSANNYENHVFLQVTGNFAGRVISSSAYLKALKKAGEELGIKYNIGTHSARKTFNTTFRKIHSYDPYIENIFLIKHFDINDIRDIIEIAYWTGKNNALETNTEVHVQAISEIIRLAEAFQK